MGAWHPRYWPLYFGMAVMYCLIQILPYSVLMAMGRGVGYLFYLVSKRRRDVARLNIATCLKHLTQREQHWVLVNCFKNVGRGFMEMLCSWWLPVWRLKRIPYQLEMPEKPHPRGALYMGSHFSCMEMAGCQFAMRVPNMYAVYQKHKDPVIDRIIFKGRSRFAKGLVWRKDTKKMMKVLRQGDALWFAPDQDMRRKHSVFVPFFGVQTATVRAMGVLLKAGKADCYESSFWFDREGYHAKVREINEMPSGDDITDALVYTQSLEALVLKNPEQYLWLHRRFKTRPEGEAPFYGL